MNQEPLSPALPLQPLEPPTKAFKTNYSHQFESSRRYSLIPVTTTSITDKVASSIHSLSLKVEVKQSYHLQLKMNIDKHSGNTTFEDRQKFTAPFLELRTSKADGILGYCLA